jgi:hypothetical protein
LHEHKNGFKIRCEFFLNTSRAISPGNRINKRKNDGKVEPDQSVKPTQLYEQQR